VSRLKTPQQKKKASLALDGRNVYGENDKASKKLIPRRKQEAHQLIRRAADRPLKSSQLTDADTAEQADFDSKTGVIQAKRKGFKKIPDAPLGACIKAKSIGRLRSRGPDGIYGQTLEPKKRKLDRS